MEMSMALPLPRGIQENILARLPLHPLMEARRVCKLWNRITNTRRFGKVWHSIKHSDGYHMLFVFPNNFIIGAFVKEEHPPFFCLNESKFMIGNNPNGGCSNEMERLVSTSGGLLLFLSLERGYVVVNPVLKLERVLPPMPLTPAAPAAASYYVIVNEGDSYKVLVAGLVEVDSNQRNARKLEMNMVGFGRMSGYFETFVAVYDSVTGRWRSTKGNGPELMATMGVPVGMGLINTGGNFCVNRANQLLVLQGTFYCIPAMPTRIFCFDINEQVWRDSITTPEGSEFVALVDYRGKLAALLRTPPAEKTFMGKRCRLSLNLYNADARKWELVEEIPGHLIPPKAVALDAWAFDQYVVLQLCTSDQPGGFIAGMEKAEMLFKLYNMKTKEAMVYPDESICNVMTPVYGMFATEFAVLLRLTFKPSIYSRP